MPIVWCMTPCNLKETDFRKNVLNVAGTYKISVKVPEYTVSHPLSPVSYLNKQQQQGVRQFLAYSIFVGI
jgi:hypothetical protein